MEQETSHSQFLVEHEIRNLLVAEEVYLMENMRIWRDKNDNDKMLTLGSWSSMIPGRAMRHDLVYAYNWALGLGGLPGTSQIDLRSWNRCLIEIFEARSGMDQIVFDVRAPIGLTTIRDFCEDLIFRKKQKEAKICQNSNKRSWILSWLYIWAQDEILMRCLHHDLYLDCGNNILFKLLEVLKLATLHKNNGILIMLVQFVEALLIGYRYYWISQFRIQDGIRFFCNISPTFRRYTQAKVNSWSVCGHTCHRNARIEYERANITFEMMYLNFREIIWSHTNGLFAAITDNNWECGNPHPAGGQCHNRNRERIYCVVNAQSDTFAIYFENGVPDLLWRRIAQGRAMKIGTEIRYCQRAIFKEPTGDKFVAAYLCTNMLDTKKKYWSVMNT